MRDFTIFKRRRYHSDPFFKMGKSELPFTQEVRRFLYVGPLGMEVWTGSPEVRAGIFASTSNIPKPSVEMEVTRAEK